MSLNRIRLAPNPIFVPPTGPGIGVLLIIFYLTATRIGGLNAAKIGIEVGNVPIFLTEIFIALLISIVWLNRTQRFILWLGTGSGTQLPGRFVWALLILAIVYGGIAFPTWRVLALRDLAIYAYALLFPLTYILVDTRRKAELIVSAFIISGGILAIVLIIDTRLLNSMLYGDIVRVFTSNSIYIKSFGGGDVGGMISFSLAGLMIYLQRPRTFVIIGTLICFFALALAQTRSAVVGLFFALLYAGLFYSLPGRIVMLTTMLLATLFAASTIIIAPDSAIGAPLNGLYLSVMGGAGLAEDDDFYFRILRWQIVVDEWQSSPLFGVGFGIPLVPNYLISPDEVGLNAGLPHNTYLTVVARTGLIGLSTILIPWFSTIVACFRQARARVPTDQYAGACGAILLAMAGYAGFVLFFERPIHNAALWIMLAVSRRLLDFSNRGLS